MLSFKLKTLSLIFQIIKRKIEIKNAEFLSGDKMVEAI